METEGNGERIKEKMSLINDKCGHDNGQWKQDLKRLIEDLNTKLRVLNGRK